MDEQAAGEITAGGKWCQRGQKGPCKVSQGQAPAPTQKAMGRAPAISLLQSEQTDLEAAWGRTPEAETTSRHAVSPQFQSQHFSPG